MAQVLIWMKFQDRLKTFLIAGWGLRLLFDGSSDKDTEVKLYSIREHSLSQKVMKTCCDEISDGDKLNDNPEMEQRLCS